MSSLSVPLVHCVPLVTGILELSSAVVVQSVGDSNSEQAENASAVCSTAFRPHLINCQVDLIFVLLKHHHFQMSNKLLGRFKSKGWPKNFKDLAQRCGPKTVNFLCKSDKSFPRNQFRKLAE